MIDKYYVKLRFDYTVADATAHTGGTDNRHFCRLDMITHKKPLLLYLEEGECVFLFSNLLPSRFKQAN
jgi:hypothetical protein